MGVGVSASVQCAEKFRVQLVSTVGFSDAEPVSTLQVFCWKYNERIGMSSVSENVCNIRQRSLVES